MAVRCFKMEVIVPKDDRDWLLELCRQCQRIQNRLWQIWLCHHSIAGSADKIREHLDADKNWRDAGKKGKRPAWPCKPLEEPLTKSPDPQSFYRIISREFGNVSSRSRGLLTNAWQSLLSKRKAANGSLPGWVAILFANESVPSFCDPQPIPFDTQNAKLLKEEGKYFVELRVDRDVSTGKATALRVPVLITKRKAAAALTVMNRLLDGTYAWKGSSLFFKKGKWFASLAYELPPRERPSCDPDKIMFIKCGRYSCLRYKISGRSSRWFGGRGEHVENARRTLESERRSRQANYKWSSSNQAGHGGRRARSTYTKLRNKWSDFVCRYNRDVSQRLVRMAIDNGCGRVVFFQPTRTRDSRRLATAGRGEFTRSSWDFFQLGTKLANVCEREGIEFGVSKKKKVKPTAKNKKKGGARKGTKTSSKKKALA